MKTYTAEEKKAYFKSLRDKWAENKRKAESDPEARAKYEAMRKESPSAEISFFSFYFTLSEMRSQGLEGLPYIDTKTFEGWKKSGFIVKKGEHSKINGITWLEITTKGKDGSESEEEGYLIPKLYKLFHRSQVEEIEK